MLPNMETETMMTTSHADIQSWATAKEARPAIEKGGTKLRFLFGETGEDLEEIGWDRFFELFDSNNLAFIYESGDSSYYSFAQRDSLVDQQAGTLDPESTPGESGST